MTAKNRPGADVNAVAENGIGRDLLHMRDTSKEETAVKVNYVKQNTAARATATGDATERLEDFGKYIPGARKELASARLTSAVGNDPHFRQPLTECWPTPAWKDLTAEYAQAGRSALDLACIRAIRDQIRTHEGRLVERHLSIAGPENSMREIAIQVMERRLKADEALELLERKSKRAGRRCRHLTTLYATIGHEYDLMRYEVIEGNENSRWVVYRRGGKYPEGSGATLTEAGKKLADRLNTATEAETSNERQARNPYEPRYQVVDRIENHGVWRRFNNRWICVRACENAEEARAAVKNDRKELDAWWERWRRIPNTRHARNEPRSPTANQGTSDPKTFSGVFCFRGVQFGNWVEDERRRTDLLDTSQALWDLALVLDWPIEWLSLQGELALAFGARGKGGPNRVRAHYEPDRRVIAISKPLGPGTLAHEWFHALDHKVGRENGTRDKEYATVQLNRRGPVASPMAQALYEYGQTLRRTPFARRAAKLDRRRPRKKPYWSTVIELSARAFEAWTATKLREHGIRNDYLVNYVGADEWTGEAELDQDFPYPYRNEVIDFEKLLKKIARAGRGEAPEVLAHTG